MPATRGELHATMNAFRSEMKTLGDRLDAKIDRAQHSLAVEIVKTQSDVAAIKATMSTKDDVRNIMAAIETFAGKAERYDRTAVFHGHSLTDLEVQVKDHEGRIKKLESGRS
ncbi:MAG: hypothetical protein HY927_01505 [Elusimicrobia bacterium]|nr:hypothetical protein [Elusimicrobiota bacterium]